MSQFQIFVDSSSDLSTEIRKELNIEYFRMGISINGEEYHADLDYEEYTHEKLYEWVGDLNNKCKTSLVSVGEFLEKMEPVLAAGKDILYFACSGALSSSINVFRSLIPELEEKYPGRKIIGIDTLRCGWAIGLMVEDALKMEKEGKTIEEIAEAINKDRYHYNLGGYVPTLSYLKAAGRVSGGKAFFGNLMQVKPVIFEDHKGENYVLESVKGAKTAWNRMFEITKELIDPNRKVIYIGDGIAEELVSYLTKRFTEELGAEVHTYKLGPIFGISCGPGTIHVCFYGKDPYEGKSFGQVE